MRFLFAFFLLFLLLQESLQQDVSPEDPAGEEGGEEDASLEEWALRRLQQNHRREQEIQQMEKTKRQREEELIARREEERSMSEEIRNLFQAVMSATEDDMSALDGMLKRGVSANSISRSGETTLHAACINGHSSVVELLLKAGANPNARANPLVSNEDMTPLSWCVQAGRFEATESLLENKKTDVNLSFIVKQFGQQPLTALDLAIRKGDEDMKALLYEYKAKTFEELQAQKKGSDYTVDEAAFEEFMSRM